MNRYGLLGAGAVSRSFIAQLPYRAQELGPVAALSYRVASRIANSLRAGTASKNVSDLGLAPTILFCSNPASFEGLLELLHSAQIDWVGKNLLLCDTPQDPRIPAGVGLFEFRRFRESGASLASVRQIELPGRFLIQGDPDAVKTARALIRQVQGRPIHLSENRAGLFQAGMTMGSALLTPLLDRAAHCFRLAGMRDKQAVELASVLFERTARDFGHSGKQSWAWHVKTPNVSALDMEIASLREFTGYEPEFLRELIAAMDAMGRHDEVSQILKSRSKKFTDS